MEDGLAQLPTNLHEPLILALDTSSKFTCLAATRGNSVLRSFSEELAGKRSEQLWNRVGSLLQGLGLTIRDVDLFSVCVGPGAFTGLRVGVAAAKGFAFAAERPIVGVSSLEAAAFAAGPAPFVCPMINAYREEVYAQFFSCETGRVPVPLSMPTVASPRDVITAARKSDSAVFTGDGAVSCRHLFDELKQQTGFDPIIRVDSGNPAEAIARVGFIKFGGGDAGKLEAIRACYVRPSEAEVKLSQGLLRPVPGYSQSREQLP